MNIRIAQSKKALIAVVLALTLAVLACGRGGIVTPQAPPAAPASTVVQTQPQSPQVSGAPALDLPVNNGIILFQDDFQDGQPDNWQTSGGWFVEQGGDLYYFGTSGRGWAWVPSGHNWNNYLFHAGVRLEAGSLFLSMNLTREGRYLLRMDQYGVYLIKEQPAGNIAILAQTGPLTMSTGHSVALASQSGHLQLYVDTVLWIDYTDAAPITGGTIGVSSLDGSRVAVDNIFVTQLASPLPSSVVQAPPVVAQEPLTVEQIQQEVAQAPIEEVEVIQEPEPEAPAAGALPDLTVTGVSWSPDPIVQSQPFQVTLEITNQGQAAAGAFTIRLHYHAATGVPDCNADFPSLAPGENGAAFCNSVSNAQPGTSPTEFTVDVEGEITESDEGNNLATPTFTIASANEGGDGEEEAEDVGNPPLSPISCTAEAVSNSVVSMLWEAPAQLQGHTGFRIYQGTTSLEREVASPDVRWQLIENLAPNTQYHFDVRAYNAAGESPADSCAVDVTTAP